MKKDFLKWHKVKELIHDSREIPYFYEREIWFCSLGLNLGFEQDGKNELFERPVVILRKFNKHVFLAVPLSSKVKRGKYYMVFVYENVEYTALLSQVRLLDSKRLTRKVRTLPDKDFERLRMLLKGIL
jgi:mRNA interferase MazF